MRGKICLVTGSTSGMGKVTARELANMGATVVLVSRNRAKGEAAQAEIKQVTAVIARLFFLCAVLLVAVIFAGLHGASTNP